MLTSNNIDKVLSTYTFGEILELNDLTEEEVLEFLLELKYLELPNIRPVDTVRYEE